MKSFQLSGTKGLVTISFLTFGRIIVLSITPVPFLSDIAQTVFKNIFLAAILLALLPSLTPGVLLKVLIVCIVIFGRTYFLLKAL